VSAATEAAIEQLVAAHPALTPVLDDHREYYGEMLPHIIMADIVRWLVDHRGEDPRVWLSVLAWMEARYSEGPEDVRNLIAVSGVDEIPDPGQPGAELRALLGPALRAVDPWGP
jgi:hypothetical protein